MTFASALGACLRTIARKPGLEVIHARGAARPILVRNVARLPEVTTTAAARGHADTLAAWLGWHDPRIHRELAPADPRFEALERLRVETLAGRLFPGMALNLGAREALPIALEAVIHDQRAFAVLSLRLLGLTPAHAIEESIRAAALPPFRDDADADQWTNAISAVGNTAGYRAFTTRFDSVVQARDLCEPAERARLRAGLDEELRGMTSMMGRLAKRLQRRLLAPQARAWDFDVDDGQLDPARLTRVLTNPLSPLLYRQQRDMPLRDTVVTLLVDNSASMRGRPVGVAAVTTEILGRTLERCGVKVEVLGFTTRTRDGGHSRREWERAGRPANPGRLGDLLHIVYKSADTPWRRADLAVMRREGLLAENIDGEALAWAHARLLARPERRRILIVVSDGAPYDETTARANTGDILPAHLRAVIDDIERGPAVELAAIGIGHDVARFYRRSVRVRDPEELGTALAGELTELLTNWREPR